MEEENEVPFPDSYWVLPGRFLAGEYPASAYFEDETRRKLRRLLEVGVNFFIDLTEPGEMNEYLEILEEEAALNDLEVDYQRMSIADYSTPAEAEMIAVLNVVDAALEAGKTVYVHCYGGVGRTGTVVGCYLARHGESGAQALESIKRLRQDIPDNFRHSPESDAQRAMVRNWQVGR